MSDALKTAAASLQVRLEEVETELGGRDQQLRKAIEQLRKKYADEATELRSERDTLKKMLAAYGIQSNGASRSAASDRPGGNEKARRERRAAVVTWMAENHPDSEHAIGLTAFREHWGLAATQAGAYLGSLVRFGHLAGNASDGYWIGEKGATENTTEDESDASE